MAHLVDARRQVVDGVVFGVQVPSRERVVAPRRELADELRRKLRVRTSALMARGARQRCWPLAHG